MTAILSRGSAHEVLRARLADLYAQRDVALAEATIGGTGDAADRATNVDAQVRLAVLEERIIAIEEELSAPVTASVAAPGVVAVGSTVTVDFGDGPEEFLLVPMDRAPAGVDVITPSSRLGQALLGAAAGAEVTYQPAPRRSATVRVLQVD